MEPRDSGNPGEFTYMVDSLEFVNIMEFGLFHGVADGLILRPDRARAFLREAGAVSIPENFEPEDTGFLQCRNYSRELLNRYKPQRL